MSWTFVDAEVALEVASHEAVIRQAYLDSVGVLTWGVGLTNATGHRVDRYVGRPADMQHCMNVYVWALDRYADQVREVFKGYTLTKAQFTAALSFHWNTGAIKRAQWVQSWKAGATQKARGQFMNWVTPKEITKRRERERDLFFDGVWYNKGKMLEYTELTAARTPRWSSGVMRDVSKEIHAALGVRIVTDHKPNPNSVPAAPTVSNPHTFLSAITALLNALFKRK
jgi:GH24 family phage-related lysozyme (muramidase)